MVDVLDIPLFDRDIPSACEQVIADISSNGERNNKLISATGAHGLVYAKKNQQFKETLLGFYMNLPDGMPAVWIGRWKGRKNMQRCYGPEFFKALMIQSSDKEVNHFFCGGNPGVADELKWTVKDRFGNANVVGTYCPPFLPVSGYNYEHIAAEIKASGAHVVWIGLSTPKQEFFARELAAFTQVNFIITVGAAFDFHTGKVAQAPALLQRLGLEWLFRLSVEPKRLYKRYLEIVPMFIYYNFKELLTFASRKILN